MSTVELDTIKTVGWAVSILEDRLSQAPTYLVYIPVRTEALIILLQEYRELKSRMEGLEK